MNAQQTLFAYTTAFAEELALAGVQHAVICPGSRSTPLALALGRQAGIRTWPLVDERAAGFFALGLAKAAHQAPVALVCTSGTAAANFLPAVVEAHYARVPLLVLTADRPPELRDTGAPQTIDQVQLYGRHAKWFVELLLPEATPEALRYVRTIAGRAVATARRRPAGVVHLNFPFREPLIPLPPEEVLRAARSPGQPYVQVLPVPAAPPPALVRALAGELAPVEQGLIVCGPQEDPALAAAVTRLAQVLDWPVLADPLSGVRCGPHDGSRVLDAYDALLRDEEWVAGHAPAVVLRFGAMPTSKALLLYLQRYPAARHLLVDADGGWQDPTLLTAQVIPVAGALLCDALRQVLGRPLPGASHAPWVRAWLQANARTRAALATRLARMEEPFEGRIFAELADLLPDGATLYVGNSMPVRDLDTFFPAGERALRILANRGANGIDGVVSSALGARAAGDGPLLLVLGDLSFYHDLNGLLAARLYKVPITIVLVNNDGGGIFSFLPQGALLPDTFERFFGTPTGLDFRPAVEMYGGRFVRPRTWEAFRAAVRAGLPSPDLTVIEMRTDRAQNVVQHRALWPAVSAALRGITTQLDNK